MLPWTYHSLASRATLCEYLEMEPAAVLARHVREGESLGAALVRLVGEHERYETEFATRHCDLLQSFQALRKDHAALKRKHHDLLWDWDHAWAPDLPAADPALPEGEDTVGRLKLGRVLSEGKCSRVRLGAEAGGAPCAVKCVDKRRCSTAHRVRNVSREIKALRALSGHEHVVAYRAAMSSPNALYIVTEAFGEDLYALIHRRGPRLNRAFVAAAAAGLTSAIAHCHASGFAHRDVKPENVLVAVTAEPRSGRLACDGVRLCDFKVVALALRFPPFSHRLPRHRTLLEVTSA